MNIEKFYDICEEHKNKLLVFNIDGQTNYLSKKLILDEGLRHNLDGNIYFIYTRNRDEAATTTDIISLIEKEAQNERWQPMSIRDRNYILEIGCFTTDAADEPWKNSNYYEPATCDMKTTNEEVIFSDDNRQSILTAISDALTATTATKWVKIIHREDNVLIVNDSTSDRCYSVTVDKVESD